MAPGEVLSSSGTINSKIKGSWTNATRSAGGSSLVPTLSINAGRKIEPVIKLSSMRQQFSCKQ